ncbi:hypothetical protein LWI28_018704 [Acer negundo]|uniref:Uncharacterized protein n=1 Tax=Acer negundo TaxID=4023 RepID=A0AAD5J9Z0_ACENE|nr:hypothetical protein LWI28_018704 [Acer negundo]
MQRNLEEEQFAHDHITRKLKAVMSREDDVVAEEANKEVREENDVDAEEANKETTNEVVVAEEANKEAAENVAGVTSTESSR